MKEGILLGLMYNCFVVVGLILISNVQIIKSNLLKSSLVIWVAGIFATFLIITILIFDKNQLEQLKSLDTPSLIQIGIGAVFVLVIGDWLYISGLSASNVTIMGYSALAYPAIALLIEIFLGNIALSHLSTKDIIGFILCFTGSALILLKT